MLQESNRQLHWFGCVILTFVALVHLPAGSNALAAPEATAAQVAVLRDSLPGMDPATTEAVAAALRREGFEIAFLSADEVCNPVALSAKKYFFYAITSPRCYPAEGAAALSDYLQAGGHLLVLGNPAQRSVFKHEGRWIDLSGVQEVMPGRRPITWCATSRTGSGGPMGTLWLDAYCRFPP